MEVIHINFDELEDYVKKYGDSIKHIIYYREPMLAEDRGRKFILVISNDVPSDDLAVPAKKKK